MLAIVMVEPLRHIARHFNMLNLITAYRDFMRLEYQNIRCHQYRIAEQPHRDAFVRIFRAGRFVLLHDCLVGMRTIQQTFGCLTRQQPCQRRNLRNI